MTVQAEALQVFYSYSHRDEKYRKRLETHLSLLQRQRVIKGWDDRKIGVGDEWEGCIDEHLEEADIILLLISADFLASAYCYDIEMTRALDKHMAGTARVIPIMLHPVDWEGAPFNHIQGLPTNMHPVTGREWHTQAEAWTDVVKGIRKVAQGLVEQRRGTSFRHILDRNERPIDTIAAYKNSLRLWQELGDRQGQAHALLNLGVTYDKSGDWDESIAAYRESRTLLGELGDRDAEAQVLALMGLVYDRKHDFDASIAAYKSSLSIREESDNLYEQAHLGVRLSLDPYHTLSFYCLRNPPIRQDGTF